MEKEEKDLSTYGMGVTLREFVDRRIDERLSDKLMVKINLRELAEKIAPLIVKEQEKIQKKKERFRGNYQDLTEKINDLSKQLKLEGSEE